MAKTNGNYELLFAVNGNLSEEDYQTIRDKFVTLINDNATDVTVDEWGKRRLAYPINYVTEGYYVLVNFQSAPDFPLELERVLGITENVMRYMVVAKDAKSLKAEAARKEAAAKAAEEAAAKAAEEAAKAAAVPAETTVEAPVETTAEEPATENAEA